MPEQPAFLLDAAVQQKGDQQIQMAAVAGKAVGAAQ